MTEKARVKVRYFAGARELAGLAEELLDVPAPLDEESLRALLADHHPSLAPHLSRMRLAVNGELETGHVAIEAGDEVDVLPPVAGGSGVVLVRIEEAPLSIDEAFAAVRHPGAGGVAIFVGVVRDRSEGKSVSKLDYEAHPSLADSEMKRAVEDVARGFPETRIAALHRVGSLSVGDLAVVVAASAAHRAEAFDACRCAIEAIKASVPIWKHEWDAEGNAHWVNLE